MLNDKDILTLKKMICDGEEINSKDLELIANKLSIAVEFINFQEQTKLKQMEFQKKIEDLQKEGVNND